MVIKERLNKKSLKLLALLLTSMLIATVSATVYRYLYIDGSITVSGAYLIWIEGTDAPADASISGSTVTIDLDVEAGTPVNFTECLFLKNANESGFFNLNITVTTNVLSSDFDDAKMHIYENFTSPGTWQYNATMDLTNPNDYYYGSLAGGQYFRMTFEVNATTTANGNKPFDIQVEYWA